jgi:hypothetical protein
LLGALFYKNIVVVAVWKISGAYLNLLFVMVIGYQIITGVLISP